MKFAIHRLYAAIALAISFVVGLAYGFEAGAGVFILASLPTVQISHCPGMANSLGTIQGALIIQRALTLALTKCPELKLFAMGFRELDGSVDNAKLGQTVSSRLQSGMTAGNFGDSPNGLTLTGVQLQLRNFRQLSVAFTPAEYNASQIDLVDHAAEPLADGLARSIVSSIAAAVCRSNFKSTVNGVNPYLTVASDHDYDNTIIEMMEMANDRGIPRNNQRYFLVNSTVNANLLRDELVIAEKNNPANGFAIQNGRLPQISGFQFEDYPLLPDTDGNLLGFAGVPDALCYVARAPESPESLVGAGSFPGTINFIEEPTTGFRVMVLQYIIPGSLSAHTVLLWLDGIGVGNPQNLIRLISGGAPGDSGKLVKATVINPGYSYLSSSGVYAAPTVAVTGGGGSAATVTAAVSNSGSNPLVIGGGAVSGLTIGAAGSGYTDTPSLDFTSPAGGKTAAHATAVATIGGLN